MLSSFVHDTSPNAKTRIEEIAFDGKAWKHGIRYQMICEQLWILTASLFIVHYG
jgi:hypothetical protein